MRDEQIIDLYWRRSEDAVRETEKKYGAYCHAVARNILHNPEDEDECVNDTWLRAWNTMPPMRPARLRMYLAKITRNLAFDCHKARTADKRGGGEIGLILEELEECIPGREDVEETVLAKELETIVGHFVRELPEREGNVFVRRYFFAEPVAEIGRRYGLSANHVMVILSRVRRKLRAHLRQEGYGG